MAFVEAISVLRDTARRGGFNDSDHDYDRGIGAMANSTAHALLDTKGR